MARVRAKGEVQKLLPHGERCKTCIMGGCASPGTQGYGFMTVDGSMSSGVLIVAEALGHHEAINEQALVGDSGFLMGRAFSRRKWKRDEFAYSNVLRCQPPNNKIRTKDGRLYPWAQDAIDHCAPYLDEDIDRLRPGCIVAFGETAFERLTGIGDVPMLQARGYAFRDVKDRTWVVPTWHPAFLLRDNFALIYAMLRDVAKARRISREGYRYEEIECIANPGLATWERFIEDYEVALSLNPQLVLASDIETPGKQEDEDEADLTRRDPIDSISFAFVGNSGFTVDWRQPYLSGIRRLLSSSGRKAFWNAPFDARILTEQGYAPEGDIIDTMDKYHVCFNSQPRKLGYATSLLHHGARMWKHLGTRDSTYQVYDAVWLWRNNELCDRVLAETGADVTYRYFIEELDPMLKAMQRVGMPVDPALRDEVSAKLRTMEEEIERDIETHVPKDVFALQVYKTERGIANIDPSIIRPMIGHKKEMTCVTCGEHPVTKTHSTRKTIGSSVSTADEKSKAIQLELPQ